MDEENFKYKLKKLISENMRELLGALAGLLIAIMLLSFGILRTIILVVFTACGFLIASKEDLKQDIKELVNRIISG